MAIMLDTCILIDYFRNKTPAIIYLESLEEVPLLSALTVAELYAGVREGSERLKLDLFVQSCSIQSIIFEIAQLGGLYRRQYYKSHGVGIVDAIIAATAKVTDITLVTLNQKHFPMLNKLVVPYQS